MSNVVVFRPERTARSVVHREGEAVQILFFTGVRYIREECPAVPAPDLADPAVAQTCSGFETERLKA